MKKIFIVLILLFLCPGAGAASMTYSGSNMDYAMTRASVPDVLDGIVFHALMNQDNGTFVRDVSTYNSNGTATGAIWQDVGGRRGMYFDGIDDGVNFGDPADGHLDLVDVMTVVTWLKLPSNATSTFKSYLGKYNNVGVSGYDFSIQSGKSRATVRGSSKIDTGSIGNDLRDNIWHHLVLVCSTSSIKTFVDGNQVGTTTGTWTGAANSENFLLGTRLANDNFINGWLDEARIYNRALSADEVNRIYMATSMEIIP